MSNNRPKKFWYSRKTSKIQYQSTFFFFIQVSLESIQYSCLRFTIESCENQLPIIQWIRNRFHVQLFSNFILYQTRAPILLSWLPSIDSMPAFVSWFKSSSEKQRWFLLQLVMIFIEIKLNSGFTYLHQYLQKRAFLCPLLPNDQNLPDYRIIKKRRDSHPAALLYA